MATKTKTATPAGHQQLARLVPDKGLQDLLVQRRQQLLDHYTLFIEQGGEEALHDFRVSLRRLRSLLRNYRKYIDCNALLLERLRELQQQTNHARDLEVFVAQLHYYCPQQRPLISALQQQLQSAYRQLQQQLPAQWATLAPTIKFSPSATTESSSLGRLTAHLGRRQLKQFTKGLKSLHHHWDETLLHRLRIRGKRLRYLLEPFAEEADHLQTITQMKEFQDSLGDYRDLQLLLQHLNEKRGYNKLIKSLHPQLQRQTERAKQYAGHDKQQALIKSLHDALQQLKQH